MGIKLGLQLKASKVGSLRLAGTPPKPKVYSGHWIADDGPIISGPELRTVDTNYSGVWIYWSEPLGSGQYYFEYAPNSITNTVAPPTYEINDFGFSTPNATSFSSGWQWRASLGDLYDQGATITPTSKPSVWKPGSILQVAFDSINHKVWLGIDGVFFNGATVADIANGLNPTLVDLPSTINTLMVKSTYGTKAKFTATVNNGQMPFQFTCPDGFTPMGTLL